MDRLNRTGLGDCIRVVPRLLAAPFWMPLVRAPKHSSSSRRRWGGRSLTRVRADQPLILRLVEKRGLILLRNEFRPDANAAEAVINPELG
jgi:hypothetical protein